MGRQGDLGKHMKEVLQKLLPAPPKAIAATSAHWESDPIRVASATRPGMHCDCHGFPPETHECKCPAPGDAELAARMKECLTKEGVRSESDEKRGFDHGAFVPDVPQGSFFILMLPFQPF